MSTPTHTGYSPPPFEDSPATLDVSQSSGTPTVDTKKQAVTPKAHAMPVLVNNDGSAEVVDSSSTDGPTRRSTRTVTRVSQKQRDPPPRRRKPREMILIAFKLKIDLKPLGKQEDAGKKPASQPAIKPVSHEEEEVSKEDFD